MGLLSACLLAVLVKLRPHPTLPPAVDEEHLDEAELDEWQDLQDRWYWLDGMSDKLDESSVNFGLAAAYRQAG